MKLSESYMQLIIILVVTINGFNFYPDIIRSNVFSSQFSTSLIQDNFDSSLFDTPKSTTTFQNKDSLLDYGSFIRNSLYNNAILTVNSSYSFENVTFSNSVIRILNAHHVSFINCTFTGYLYPNEQLLYISNSTNISISYSNIQNISLGSFQSIKFFNINNSSNITIYNNYINVDFAGSFNQIFYVYESSNVIVHNNIIDMDEVENLNIILYLRNTKQLFFENNTIHSTDSKIILSYVIECSLIYFNRNSFYITNPLPDSGLNFVEHSYYVYFIENNYTVDSSAEFLQLELFTNTSFLEIRSNIYRLEFLQSFNYQIDHLSESIFTHNYFSLCSECGFEFDIDHNTNLWGYDNIVIDSLNSSNFLSIYTNIISVSPISDSVILNDTIPTVNYNLFLEIDPGWYSFRHDINGSLSSDGNIYTIYNATYNRNYTLGYTIRLSTVKENNTSNLLSWTFHSLHNNLFLVRLSVLVIITIDQYTASNIVNESFSFSKGEFLLIAIVIIFPSYFIVFYLNLKFSIITSLKLKLNNIFKTRK